MVHGKCSLHGEVLYNPGKDLKIFFGAKSRKE
jgi:hypothetical protein